MKASDLLLKCLELHGVKTIFGVPGEENADVMISLLDSQIDFITTRHEQTASFMATMHGQLTGIPGICLATLGPGATNLLTGVAQANMDNAPLIAIIGQADSDRLHKTSHQNMDSISMYKPVTKWSETIRDASVIPEIMAKAFKIATNGIPGAVLIELPEDIAKHETTAKPFKVKDTRTMVGTTTAQINKMLNLISRAKKPILFLGDGAVRYECHKELHQFLKITKLYTAYTFMGKGAISNLYDRSLYCAGLGFKDFVIKAFEESDLVIAVGYDMVEYPPASWNHGVKKKIIHINSAPAEVDAYYIPDQEIVGNIKTIFKQITIELNNIAITAYQKEVPYYKALQSKIQNDVRSDNNSDDFPMRPKRILRDIRDVLRDSDILVSDVGAHKMWVAREYGARLPKTCFISNGFCSMGGSLAGAMEAKRLYPEKNVVALCGDGGFMMSIQALATGVAHKIPFTAIIWEDDYYGLIKWKQEMTFHKHSHVALDNPDLKGIIKSFGCHVERVTTAYEFKDILERSLSYTDSPSIILVPVDYSENMKLFHHLNDVIK